LTVIWNVDGVTVLTNLVSANGPPTTANLVFARTFTPGAHAVRVTVSDGKDSVTAETTVTVEADVTAPVITSVGASPDVLWPPDHRMVPVTVNVSASDDCGDFTSRIIEVTSNEPPSSPFSGDAVSGWEITGPLSAYLRAERSGAGGGRVYSITIECQDTAGNRTTQNVTVGVPLRRLQATSTSSSIRLHSLLTTENDGTAGAEANLLPCFHKQGPRKYPREQPDR
jgi:hypothetical protein